MTAPRSIRVETPVAVASAGVPKLLLSEEAGTLERREVGSWRRDRA